MPLPQKKDDESNSSFISRCMSDEKMMKEYPNGKQRIAVCINQTKASIEELSDKEYSENYGFTEELNENNFYVPAEEEYVDFKETTEDWDISLAKPGLWENIRKKKEREGKNYRPAKPGDPDRPTPDQIKRAQSTKDAQQTEAVQYGKPPKNDPRKTPAPKKDQKRGSKKNKPGSAKNPKNKITFSEKTISRLKKMVSDHNAKGKGSKATLGMLKAVYRRGAGAYSTSHHPKMSRDGWAIARVNAFLYLLRNGKPSNPNYKQDNDLLPKSHPRSSKADTQDYDRMQISQINKMREQLAKISDTVNELPIEFEEWVKDKISKAEHYVETIYDFVFFYDKYKDKQKQEVESEYKYEDPKTGEIYTFDRKGVYKKDDRFLIPVKAAKYQGRTVKLNKPFRTPKGPKKFSVYVKNDKGNVVKVNFGDPNMEIKRDNPKRRKSFRARHHCDTNPGPKWKARYWSCRMW